MDQKFIPDDVAQLVIDKIDSVAELEALLLLRNEPGRRWTAGDISKRLYLADQDAAAILTALSSKGHYNPEGAYEYQPGSPETGRMVDRLREIYSKQIVPATN